MSRRYRTYTGQRSSIQQQKDYYEKRRQERDARNREYRRRQQEKKAARTRARLSTLRNNRANAYRMYRIQGPNRFRTTGTSRLSSITKRAVTVLPGYRPVKFAIGLFQPCKRARTAQRHNVFRKINRLGFGSIAKRTARKIACRGK